MLYMLLSYPRRFVGHLGLLGMHHVHEHTHSSTPHPTPSDVKVSQRLIHVCPLHQTSPDDPVLREPWNVKVMFYLQKIIVNAMINSGHLGYPLSCGTIKVLITAQKMIQNHA